MFNEKFVVEHTNKTLPRGTIRQIIRDMNGDNYREVLTILRIKGTFIKQIWEDKTVKRSYLIDTPGLTQNELNNLELIRLLCNIQQRNRETTSKDLLEKHFPVWCNIVENWLNNKELFNVLQVAAFRAKVLSNPEVFKQYCKEIEILLLVSHDDYYLMSKCDELMMLDSELIDKAIEEINKNYYAIGHSFGYKTLNEFKLLSEINLIGSDNFINNVNRPLDISLAQRVLLDIKKIWDNKSSTFDFSKEMKQKFIKSILSIPKTEINIQTLFFTSILLIREPELRKSSRIVEHMPKIKDVDFLELDEKYRPIYKIMTEFIKVSEVELGINDTSDAYKVHHIFQIVNLNDYLTEQSTGHPLDFYRKITEKSYDFCFKYFVLFNREIKREIIENLTFKLFKPFILHFGGGKAHGGINSDDDIPAEGYNKIRGILKYDELFRNWFSGQLCIGVPSINQAGFLLKFIEDNQSMKYFQNVLLNHELLAGVDYQHMEKIKDYFFKKLNTSNIEYNNIEEIFNKIKEIKSATQSIEFQL